MRERPDVSSNLEPTDRDYLTACRESELAGHRKKRRIQGLVGFLMLFLATAGVGWLNRDFLTDQYVWRIDMQAPVFETGEKELASGPEFTECRNGCPVMVVVPAGKFQMGTEGLKDPFCRDKCEHPQHEVEIDSPFAVSKTEVTFAQWGLCVKADECQEREDSGWGRNDRPVINVGWPAAVAYTKWLSRLSGKDYRLLSEAEWEYAARAGNPARYSFGDNESELGQYAWFINNSGEKTQPVRKKKANAFGIQDMHGNVLEWLADHYHTNYKDAPLDRNAWVKKGDKKRRMVRGGSFKDTPDKLRSASRDGGTADERGYQHVGFRLARTLKP